jgi:glycosyltransferase involved in cell wall biosynthesis
MRLQGEVTRNEAMLRAADRMEERERAIWRAADSVLYLSEEEAGMVAAMEPNSASHAVLPYCFDRFGSLRRPPAAPWILFVAGFGHPPNEHAVCWFAESVLPQIRARVPQARLAVVGSNPTSRVLALEGDGVEVHANVSDAALAEWYRRARVAAVPLHFGAGVKLKVVEALREGLPLVTTPIGAQGLPGLDCVVSIESDPVRMADAVCALLTDDALWTARCAAQIAYAQERYSAAALQQSVLAAMGIAVPAAEAVGG